MKKGEDAIPVHQSVSDDDLSTADEKSARCRIITGTILIMCCMGLCVFWAFESSKLPVRPVATYNQLIQIQNCEVVVGRRLFKIRRQTLTTLDFGFELADGPIDWEHSAFYRSALNLVLTDRGEPDGSRAVMLRLNDLNHTFAHIFIQPWKASPARNLRSDLRELFGNVTFTDVEASSSSAPITVKYRPQLIFTRQTGLQLYYDVFDSLEGSNPISVASKPPVVFKAVPAAIVGEVSWIGLRQLNNNSNNDNTEENTEFECSYTRMPA